MGLVATLLGRTPKKPPDPRMSGLQATSREQTRRELLAMAVRDTLRKHGLPAGCITAEALPAATAARQGAMHVQLVFRHPQPRLLSYAVALEAAVRSRLARLDPLSASWMVSLSWRFEPADRALWPQLPARGQSNPVSAPSRNAAPRNPRVSLEGLLKSGDAAFRGRGEAHVEFSPTLPMQGG